MPGENDQTIDQSVGQVSTVAQVDLRKVSEEDMAEHIEDRRKTLVAIGLSEGDIQEIEKHKPKLFDSSKVRNSWEFLLQQNPRDPLRIIRNYPDILSFGIPYTQGQIDGYRKRGFTDPIRLIERYPPSAGTELENVDTKIKDLSARRFRNPVQMIEANPSLIGYKIETIDDKLRRLADLGFSNPQRLIEANPQILGYEVSSIADLMKGLQERGFKNPIRLIELNQSLPGYSLETIDSKIAGLEERGFTDTITLLERGPTIIDFSDDNLDKKFEHLQQLGFPDVNNTVMRFPTILYLTPETIDKKVDSLREHGFGDPIALIDSYPSLIGLAKENVDEKIQYLEKVTKLYDLPITAQEILEAHPVLFGTKFEKIQVLVRVLRETASQKDITDRTIKQLLFANLEDVAIALSETPEDAGTQVLLNKIKEVKKLGFDKADKQAYIADSPDINGKIRRTYARGYLKDKKETETT